MLCVAQVKNENNGLQHNSIRVVPCTVAGKLADHVARTFKLITLFLVIFNYWEGSPRWLSLVRFCTVQTLKITIFFKKTKRNFLCNDAQNCRHWYNTYRFAEHSYLISSHFILLLFMFCVVPVLCLVSLSRVHSSLSLSMPVSLYSPISLSLIHVIAPYPACLFALLVLLTFLPSTSRRK